MPGKPERAATRYPATRYLACLYSPAAHRPVMEALCAIESEIAGSLRPGIDHRVAHTRLQWWREECERLAEGRPIHPLARELVSAYGPARSEDLPSPLAELSGLVDSAVWDLAGATFETRSELTAYCQRWSAAMIESAGVHALGGSHRWQALGVAMREIELISDLAREAHSGRIRLPLDELERAGVDPSGLATTPWAASLVTLLRERHAALRAELAASIADISPSEQAQARGLLVWAALAARTSLRAERALPNPIRAHPHDAILDSWHAWRAGRHAIIGNFKMRSLRA
jgi:15-cis-phytoene synthase